MTGIELIIATLRLIGGINDNPSWRAAGEDMNLAPSTRKQIEEALREAHQLKNKLNTMQRQFRLMGRGLTREQSFRKNAKERGFTDAEVDAFLML